MNQEVEPCADKFEECADAAALYALGALPPEQAQAVELRLRSGCPICTSQVEHYSAVAEHLSLSVTPVAPPSGLKEKLLARIRQQNGAVQSTEQTAEQSTEHRKVIRGTDVPWVNMRIPGVERRSLIGEKTFLVRMQPGAALPKHEHPQAEQCYVLSGSLTDSDGLTLHAGDFVVMSRGTKHDPVHSATGCTLLIAYAD